MEPSLKRNIEEIKAFLLDIEGTTTSISFVKDTLFPYVRKHLQTYVESQWSKTDFADVLRQLKEQSAKDVDDKVDGVVTIPDGEGDGDEKSSKEAVVKNVLWQMDNDRKTGALKDLQGRIFQNGYKTKELVGHIYDDVFSVLKSWTAAGKKVYIYSSGSVEAQKLLFGNTKEGSLLSQISGHFDTAVGPKGEADSYRSISKEIGYQPSEILFLTDIPKEARAAKEAGLQTVLVARDGNVELTEEERKEFSVIWDFSGLLLEHRPAKKPKLDVEINGEENKVASKENGECKESEDVEMEDLSEDVKVTEAIEEKVEIRGESEVTNDTEAKCKGDTDKEDANAAKEKRKNVDQKESDVALEDSSTTALVDKNCDVAVGDKKTDESKVGESLVVGDQKDADSAIVNEKKDGESFSVDDKKEGGSTDVSEEKDSEKTVVDAKKDCESAVGGEKKDESSVVEKKGVKTDVEDSKSVAADEKSKNESAVAGKKEKDDSVDKSSAEKKDKESEMVVNGKDTNEATKEESKGAVEAMDEEKVSKDAVEEEKVAKKENKDTVEAMEEDKVTKKDAVEAMEEEKVTKKESKDTVEAMEEDKVTKKDAVEGVEEDTVTKKESKDAVEAMEEDKVTKKECKDAVEAMDDDKVANEESKDADNAMEGAKDGDVATAEGGKKAVDEQERTSQDSDRAKSAACESSDVTEKKTGEAELKQTNPVEEENRDTETDEEKAKSKTKSIETEVAKSKTESKETKKTDESKEETQSKIENKSAKQDDKVESKVDAEKNESEKESTAGKVEADKGDEKACGETENGDVKGKDEEECVTNGEDADKTTEVEDSKTNGTMDGDDKTVTDAAAEEQIVTKKCSEESVAANDAEIKVE